jgi:hypothetical protein
MGILLSGYTLGDPKKGGVSLPNAYARFKDASQHADSASAEILMSIWATKESRDAGDPCLKEHHIGIPQGPDIAVAFGELEWPGPNPSGSWGNQDKPTNIKEWGYWIIRNIAEWDGAKE